MALNGNKGELSELYAFFRLLADGKLFCGDGHLNRYDDKFYPILSIFRDDSPNRNMYKVDEIRRRILISGESLNITISQDDFLTKSSQLFEYLSETHNEALKNEIEAFMDEIKCGGVKAKSSDKADIRIVIHNLNTGSKPELGYSIKSKVGGSPTLFNANKNGTNFIYRISNFPSTRVEEFNSLSNFRAKFQLLNSLNASVEFVSVMNQTFHENLLMLDTSLERILAEELLCYYSGQVRTLEDATEILKTSDPLHLLTPTTQVPMYEYKIKQFLVAYALGMTANKPWTGRFNANGGYIIVKEDGDIVCYHFFDRNDLEDYMFFNLRFDTPSTSRHNFGNIYNEGDELRINLNIQLRFTD